MLPEAEVVLLGVYRNMVTDAMYGYHLSILFDMGTDVSQVEGSNNNGFRAVPTNSFTTSAAEDTEHLVDAVQLGIQRQ